MLILARAKDSEHCLAKLYLLQNTNSGGVLFTSSSDAKLSNKGSKTTTASIEETRLYHRRYLIAVNSPLRRGILQDLRKGSASVEQLQNVTKLEKATLEWHLGILEHGFCIGKKYGRVPKYKLTQEGKVADYMG